ncbi:unnamed protein product [Ambrosiozyma monospora]|uniref:Unnamed protein product n=1 Tax=Ambrosiozyma monospora TaxID=43982 RepID=A0ACB5TVK8_AMBMO|nr:unnamed protein product [Ambrosiozyma monospora]
MAIQFMKRLFGLNHYKFLVKDRMDQVCDLDVGRRPLGNQLFRFPINVDQDFEFLKLKSPLILFILDRRMTKTDKSFGLSRVIPKIFLQAMSGDLISGNCLSTAHFQHVCEKVAHHKLEGFFNNWVHFSGVPTFRITQRFNRKRMMIEMTIRQMQRGGGGLGGGSNGNGGGHGDSNGGSDEAHDADAIRKQHLRDNFVDEANKLLADDQAFDPQNVFTGPITIRIHEADGTPYEHIVDIREPYTKIDIQYNTKYRRVKKKKLDDNDDEDGTGTVTGSGSGKKSSKNNNNNDDDGRVQMLGDILTSSSEMEAWGLKEDDNVDENGNGPENTVNTANSTNNSNNAAASEAFEWIRVDADFEWIAKFNINQQDRMFESQLRQDRDVEAQLESVRYFANGNRPTVHHGNVLLRTLLDKRYFYGVRLEAAKGLARISKEENDHLVPS